MPTVRYSSTVQYRRGRGSSRSLLAGVSLKARSARAAAAPLPCPRRRTAPPPPRSESEMPRSKRNKVVHLTQTGKKGSAKKQELIDAVRASLDEYQHCYIFEFGDMRSTALKEFRRLAPQSRFFLGRNRVMQLALGRSEAEEYQDNTHVLAEQLKGHRGLFFSNDDAESTKAVFADFVRDDFARGGSVAQETVELEAGPLTQFAIGQIDQLRKLGLVCEVHNSQVCLMEKTTVCREGKKITPEMAKVLELLGMKLAEFRVQLVCHYNDGGIDMLS